MNTLLSEVLFNKFGNTRLRYTGTIFGDPDQEEVMTGLEWIGLLHYLGMEVDDIFLSHHPDETSGHVKGFYFQAGDIWYRSGYYAPEMVFEVLEERITK